MPTSLAAARAAAGLSQAALARAAGVSRPLVASVEAGRQAPNVHAALALAAALGTTVEALFAPGATAAGTAPLAVTTPCADGAPVVLARVGEAAVCAPAPWAGGAAEAWATADAVLQDGTSSPFDPAPLDGFVVAGCDPALGLAAVLGPGRGAQRVVAVGASSAEALEALAGGRAHAALVHAPPGTLPVPPVPVVRVRVARWAVGLATALGARRSVEALLDGPIVQRAPDASAQRALERRLRAEGRDAPSGPRATGHLDGARRVGEGARAALTMEPAARACGLGFLELEEHDVELWIGAGHADHPGAQALVERLGDAAFGRRLAAIGGYDLAGAGTEVAA